MNRHADNPCDKIKTTFPGYLGTPGYVLNGYPPGSWMGLLAWFHGLLCNVVVAMLYTHKITNTSADLLNDQVSPFTEAQGLPLLHILTDLGTEFCGKTEPHGYELYLAINDIDHSKSKVKSAQMKGTCEPIHKTIQQEIIR